MSNEALVIAMYLALVVGLIGLGSYLCFILGMIAVVAGFIGWGGTDFLALFPLKIWSLMHNFVLVAIPLFVFMGYMLERAGFAEDLFGGSEVLMGRFRGGMAIMVITITTLLAACTGIVATGVIMAGVLALPSMLRRGYDKGLALGTVAAGGTLGQLIPPSILLIFYASMTGLSVGQLFLAAIGPGLTFSALFITYIIVITTIRPKMAPRLGEVPERPEYGIVEHPITESRHPRLRVIRGGIPLLFIIATVLGTIIAGIASPTEAAAGGAFAAMLVAVAYRRLNFATLKHCTTQTVATMGMFGGILIGAMCFTAIFSGLGGSEMVYKLVMGMDAPPLVVLLVILGLIFILGMFIDPIPILLITLYAVLPVQEILGWHELWFALLICATLQSAWLSPPFGISLFLLRGLNLPGVSMGDIIRGCLPFVAVQLIGVGLCIAFPQIILFLPRLVFG